MISHNLGYPRIGEKRELKKSTEKYWKKEITLEQLLKEGRELRKKNWLTQSQAGIDLIPVNDFSFYDQMLDMSILLGVFPERFKNHLHLEEIDLKFLIARGGNTPDLVASEMTKWLDTNYHFIVPELNEVNDFKISSQKIFDEVKEAQELNINAKPVLIGPFTFLRFAKFYQGENTIERRLTLLPKLVKIYEEILQKLDKQGVSWIQIDEPVLSLDLSKDEKKQFFEVYQILKKSLSQAKLIVVNYFGKLSENLNEFINLPVDAIHVDLIKGADELPTILDALSKTLHSKKLSLGLVDGRNIWKNNLENSLSIINKVKASLNDNFMISSSCSLIHSPVTISNETKMDKEILSWMSFAKEKLDEINLLTIASRNSNDDKFQTALAENKKSFVSKNNHSQTHNPIVEKRLKEVSEKDYQRSSLFAKRIKIQQEHLKLPQFPTTTIGSFPQTPEIRKKRSDFKKNIINQSDYEAFLKEEISNMVKIQEEIGLDVLVHGEPERNDMVEYFGEQLNGYVFSQFGWVQSYGSRYVKPPIIFGSIHRPNPMTITWSSYAKSLSKSPMKGMLTGPITMLQWSFVRNDQPRSKTAFEIALALRDEVVDLEKAGLDVIQVDEPAIREGLPLRKKDWQEYLRWAVDAFKLSTCGVKDNTQIHTHMCYSDFNDIISSIAALDADVISIETSRSRMELLQCFADFKFPNDIGPGVYDIHSPRVPTIEEMVLLLKKAAQVIDPQRIWVNPDCGLKTRQWEEVKAALKNMVAAAKIMRG